MSVAVVTDSTADLPPDAVRDLGITVVPLNLHMEDRTYQDGVDITAQEFYQRLATATRLPTTSQPSVGAFLQTYEAVGANSSGIVSVHISAKLSGTYNSALNAQNAYHDCPAEVVDAATFSLGLGMVVMVAARAAAKGASLQQIVEEARSAMRRTHVFFFVDTLEYLARGGRIGKARALVGSLLNIKPILTCHEGEVHPVDRARTRSRATERLLSLVQALGPIEETGVIHSTTPDEAEALAQRVAPLVTGDLPVLTSRIGPVVGTHAGPGVVGIAARTT